MEFLARSDRLVLRRPEPADRQAYLDLLRSSETFHAPWFPVCPVGSDPFGIDVFRAYLEGDTGERCLRLLIFRCASDVKEPHTLVGAVNFNELVRGVFQSAYLGYWLGAAFTGQGLMREALGLAVTAAFRQVETGGLGLHRVEANIMPHNHASIAVVRALGFHKEGLSRRYLKIAGEWQDHERWARLADDV